MAGNDSPSDHQKDSLPDHKVVDLPEHQKEFHLAEYEQISVTMEALMERVADTTKLGIFVTGAVFAWIITTAFEQTPSGAVCARLLSKWAVYIPPAIVILIAIYSAAAAKRWLELREYIVVLEGFLAAPSIKGLNRHREVKSWILVASMAAYVLFIGGSILAARHLNDEITSSGATCVQAKQNLSAPTTGKANRDP